MSTNMGLEEERQKTPSAIHDSQAHIHLRVLLEVQHETKDLALVDRLEFLNCNAVFNHLLLEGWRCQVLTVVSGDASTVFELDVLSLGPDAQRISATTVNGCLCVETIDSVTKLFEVIVGSREGWI